MSNQLIINCHRLYEREYRTPDGMRAVHTWMRTNGIEPDDVPVSSTMVIEDSAFGVVIRYEVFRRTPNGWRFPDPDNPDRLATEARTALLVLPPPTDWLTEAGGGR